MIYTLHYVINNIVNYYYSYFRGSPSAYSNIYINL